MTEKLLTIQEARARLAPLGYHIGDLIRREEIGFVKEGRRKLIPESEVVRHETWQAS